METKHCTKCGEEKTIDEFSKFRVPRDQPPHFKSTCKRCSNGKKRRNPDRERAYNKKRYVSDREALPDAQVANRLHMRLSDCTPELIEIKREQILARRMTKQLTNILKEHNHGIE